MLIFKCSLMIFVNLEIFPFLPSLFFLSLILFLMVKKETVHTQVKIDNQFLKVYYFLYSEGKGEEFILYYNNIKSPLTLLVTTITLTFLLLKSAL